MPKLSCSSNIVSFKSLWLSLGGFSEEETSLTGRCSSGISRIGLSLFLGSIASYAVFMRRFLLLLSPLRRLLRLIWLDLDSGELSTGCLRGEGAILRREASPWV
jgi:hypothetical protein